MQLAESSGSGKQVARVSYYTSASGFLVITTPGRDASLPLRTDLNVADLVVEGPVEELGMRLDGPADAPDGRDRVRRGRRRGLPDAGLVAGR